MAATAYRPGMQRPRETSYWPALPANGAGTHYPSDQLDLRTSGRSRATRNGLDRIREASTNDDGAMNKRLRVASADNSVNRSDGHVAISMQLRPIPELNQCQKTVGLTEGDVFFIAMLPQGPDPSKCSNQAVNIPQLNDILKRSAYMRAQIGARSGSSASSAAAHGFASLVVTPTPTKSAAEVLQTRWSRACFVFSNEAPLGGLRMTKGGTSSTTAVVGGFTFVKAMFKPVDACKQYYVPGDLLFVVAKEIETIAATSPDTAPGMPTKYLQMRAYCVSPAGVNNGQLFSNSNERLGAGTGVDSDPLPWDTTYVERDAEEPRAVYRKLQPVLGDDGATHMRYVPVDNRDDVPAAVGDEMTKQHYRTRVCRAFVHRIGVVKRSAPVPPGETIEQAWTDVAAMARLNCIEVDVESTSPYDLF